MKVRSILIQLDDATCKALNQVSPAGRKTEFIRQAIKQAIRREEYARIREGYRKQPDSTVDVDDWSRCEEFKTGFHQQQRTR
jgi:predicted transcriptional regulator